MNETCSVPGAGLRVPPDAVPLPNQPAPIGLTELVLAGGCFWCTEAVFAAIDGVETVQSGYVGGTASTANYDSVCTGSSGHAEAIRLRFDPERVSAGRLLQLFFAVAHDPTQKDRQGNDRGRQYRSALFYQDESARQYLASYLQQLDAAGCFAAAIATTLEPLTEFYLAEPYHQQYAARNPAQPYIRAVAQPKLAKLQQYFAEAIKPG